jgi:hypothetical protein
VSFSDSSQNDTSCVTWNALLIGSDSFCIHKRYKCAAAVVTSRKEHALLHILLLSESDFSSELESE